MPPVRPMLARATYTVPRAEGLLYEPKWDGFRCVAFVDGDDVELESRRERPFTRYFPEVADDLRRAVADRCVLDGELVVVTPGGLDFLTLQSRIHPAASRVARLAAEAPASFVAFDVLAVGDRDLRAEPFRERRRILEQVVGAPAGVRVHVTPLTGDPDVAEDWFGRFEGAGFDGVMAKPADGAYEEGRRAQFKVKHLRTADCVVVGLKRHKDGLGVGSLLLALVGDDGTLHHVGAAASFTAEHRRRLLEELAPWREGADEAPPWSRPAPDERADGGPSPDGNGDGAQSDDGDAAQSDGGNGAEPGGGWARLRELGWEPLRPERVVEVRYDPVAERWFRSPARLVRWRDDKAPADCHDDQLHAVAPDELGALMGPVVPAR